MENAHYFLHVTDTHLRFDAEAPDTCCTEQALRSLYQTAFAWDQARVCADYRRSCA